MPSNFDFLQQDWTTLHEDAAQVELNVFLSPRTGVFCVRRTLERAVNWIYENDSGLHKPYQQTLTALIYEPSFREVLPTSLFQNVRLIHKLGNLAVHSGSPINSTDSLHIARMLHAFLGWVSHIYSRTAEKVPPFDDSLLPRPSATPAPDKTGEQLRELQDQLDQKDAALTERAARIEQTDAEIAQLREEIAELRKEREQQVSVEVIDEATTRDLFIDVLLREAGWNPHAPNAGEFPVTGMPTESGEGFVDYVLWGADKLPLAVVEAKRTTRDATEGKRQAELYADCLEQMTGQRPVIFYTNGYEHWMWDDQSYPPRQVQGFYTRDELQLLINRRTSRQELRTVSSDPEIAGRYYQQEAIQRVCETFDTNRQRKALLVMATGTGKTRVSIATVGVLMKANWVRRVLFLADRNSLLIQAQRNFTRYLPNTASVDLTREREDDNKTAGSSSPPTRP